MTHFKKTAQFLLIIILLLSGASKGYCQFSDRILAVVNDNAITMQDLKQFLSMLYINLASTGRSKEEIKEIMSYYQANGLSRLIDNKLIVDAADQKELIIRPEGVDKRIDEIKSKFQTEKEFLDDLTSQGLTVSEVRERILEDLKIRYMENSEVSSKVFVSPQEVTTFYEENIDKFKKPETVELDSIFIPNEGRDPKDVEREAKKALELLNNKETNKTFAEVAKNFSDSPAIGTIARGEAIPEIEDVVFNLKEGEVSSIVPVETGIYIFQVKKKTPESIPSLEEAKEYIQNILTQKQTNELREAWLKKLRNEAYIEIK
ncbi:MAG: peptidyl-prolyl cis-trans isomerase [Candidatus Omnitrophica bacterium]|nr:peptidyl-prolyl cis-trans isomerase [Candidatus Omnitrophota bacterium]